MKLPTLMAGLAMIGALTGFMGGCKGREAAKEITVVSREDGSGTRSAFVELFNMEEEIDGAKVDMTTDEAQITNSTSVVISTVAQDEYAIGYISMGALSDQVKVLPIDGAKASAENVKNGSYKISRPFQIAVKQENQNELKEDFINFILSPEGQAVVEDAGYISLTGAEAYKTNRAAGKLVVGGSSSVAPVMEKLVEAYKVVNSDAKVELQVTDSTTGMAETAKGNYDIGMASRKLKESELEAGLVSQTIALDGIAVIVNNDSAVDQLSSDQVRGIYTGDLMTWDEVEK